MNQNVIEDIEKNHVDEDLAALFQNSNNSEPKCNRRDLEYVLGQHLPAGSIKQYCYFPFTTIKEFSIMIDRLEK